MSLAGSRSLFSLVFAVGALASWAAWHLQYGVGLEPCSLWSVQRFFILLFTGVSLVAALHGPGRLGSRCYWWLNLLSSLGGVLTAGRHVLLQNVASDQLLACLPDIPFMLRNMSAVRTLQLVFQGTSDCADVTWTLVDMSAPEWSLLVFAAMLVLSVYRLLRLTRRRPVLP